MVRAHGKSMKNPRVALSRKINAMKAIQHKTFFGAVDFGGIARKKSMAVLYYILSSDQC